MLGSVPLPSPMAMFDNRYNNWIHHHGLIETSSSGPAFCAVSPHEPIIVVVFGPVLEKPLGNQMQNLLIVNKLA